MRLKLCYEQHLQRESEDTMKDAYGDLIHTPKFLYSTFVKSQKIPCVPLCVRIGPMEICNKI